MEDKTKEILKRYSVGDKKAKEILLGSLALDDLGALVDDAVTFGTMQKKGEKGVDIIKPVLLAYARHKKEKRLAGFQGFAEIKKKSTSVITPKDLLKYLVKADKKKLFYDLIKVGITDAKKFLGEAAIKDITVTTTEEYGSVSIKENKSE